MSISPFWSKPLKLKYDGLLGGAFWFGVVALVASVWLVFGTGGSWPHSFFAAKCCGGRDCLPAAPNSVTWTPAGWAVASTQEVVPFNDIRIQYNPPGEPQFYICRLPARTTLTCLYIPAPES